MIAPVSAAVTAREPDSPAKIHDAAQQFEALLMSQILRAARQNGGWMGSGDASTDCALEYAEQQFATVLAHQGGLGLAALIEQGLTPSKP